MIEVIGGIILGVIFLLHLFGAYLTVQDKQSDYENRINYAKMKREVDKNDSSRVG